MLLGHVLSRALMRRYYVMEKVRDAGTVGILVGTMGMAGFRDIIKHLKNILKLSGKKSYTFVVGKLNPQKLANFPEVRCRKLQARGSVFLRGHTRCLDDFVA